MGQDLRLLPACDMGYGCEMSFDLLTVYCDCDLFELIEELEENKGVDVMRGGINSFSGEEEGTEFEGTCYGKTEFTSVEEGIRMKSVLAGELKPIFAEYKTQDWRQKAVFAFVKELPDNLPIYLYWH